MGADIGTEGMLGAGVCSVAERSGAKRIAEVGTVAVKDSSLEAKFKVNKPRLIGLGLSVFAWAVWNRPGSGAAHGAHSKNRNVCHLIWASFPRLASNQRLKTPHFPTPGKCGPPLAITSLRRCSPVHAGRLLAC